MPGIADLMLRVGEAKAAGIRAKGAGLAGLVSGVAEIPAQIGALKRQQADAALDRNYKQAQINNLNNEVDNRNRDDQRAVQAQQLAQHAQQVSDALATVLTTADPAMKAQVYQQRRADLLGKGIIDPTDFPEQFPGDGWARVQITRTKDGIERLKALAPEPKQPFAVGGSVAIPDGNGGVTFQTPPHETPQERPIPVDTVDDQGNHVTKYLLPSEAAGKTFPKYDKPEAPKDTGAKDDAEAIADAIINGDQPPVLTGLYSKSAAVRAAMARKGFNLTDATKDWQAISAYTRTLNGAQQTRLRQATEFVNESVGLVRELSDNLTKNVPRGQFPTLNKASIKAAKSGALGEKAQTAATQLEAQIADMQSELAVMYRGGNASTDEALKKASEMLKGDWSAPQLESALKLIERNARIRLNSINNTGVAGGDNRYAPRTPDQAPPKGDPLGIR